ncbi:uncharacterized protein LOC108107246 [Drosophila eugracilis]|uniref:uncharacterized protein LOC108107246 n=1 Tax=Drosophila eugracilis TaxID=29029 RepID=UPI0007E6A2C4|nr:uncharacterized protein LOC108107246 [Drosophila eugracilis]
MNALHIFLWISMGPIALRGHMEFNNVICLVRDRKFMDFEYCHLKSVNRTFKYFSLKTKLFHLPIDNCVTKFQLRKRESRRILYNFDFQVDACQFLRERKHVLANWAYQTFGPFSNMNHTCPYVNDIVVDKLPVQHVNKLVQTIIPDGRYFMNSTWVVAGIARTDVILYFTKS